MFQDIYPHNFDNQFKDVNPEKEDRVLCFAPGKVALKNGEIPSLSQLIEDGFFIEEEKMSYGFAVDEEQYFIYRGDAARHPFDVKDDLGWQFINTREVRGFNDRLLVFTILMGTHLYDWYSKNKYCGKCGHLMVLGTEERNHLCPNCGNVVYPRISPVVIVGVTDGDEILLTKYADRDYKRYALIAGFMEFGESPEDTVRREVYEEAGLRVKNIRYYKSQPWPYPDSLLMGFYAQVDGDKTPILRDGELKEATWYKREDMPIADADFALTSELMENFRTEGK